MNTTSCDKAQHQTHYVEGGGETVAYVPIDEVRKLVSSMLEKTTAIGSMVSEFRRLRDRRYAKYLLRSAEDISSIAQKVAITAEDYEWLKRVGGEDA